MKRSTLCVRPLYALRRTSHATCADRWRTFKRRVRAWELKQGRKSA